MLDESEKILRRAREIKSNAEWGYEHKANQGRAAAAAHQEAAKKQAECAAQLDTLDHLWAQAAYPFVQQGRAGPAGLPLYS